MISHKELVRRAAAEACLTGKLPCSVYGSERHLLAFSEAFYATRTFDRTLAESEDLGAVSMALEAKRAAAARFRREYGFPWPA